ncbi:hypothetical protein MLD38_018929 [Melastoma candidum]|uniref:Uncharacterized protein n=1 Tax=Melastoma candidum TaxID=119954 RepID=A0ACB9QVI9_9MYRT|nr:hypothetical protein MLD38_018929 [Melastoma candidum]
MVLKKRLPSRPISFEVPVVPRAPRSSRRRVQHNRIADCKHLCPIELLASLAGKLLQESESSSASNNASDENDVLALCENGIKEERQDVDKPLKVESPEQGSWEESTSIAERCSECKELKCKFENYPQAESDHSQECTSVISGAKPVVCSNIELGDPCTRSFAGILDDGKGDVSLESANRSSFKHLFRDRAVGTNDPEIKLRKRLYGDPVRLTSFSGHKTGTNLVNRDDDKNFSRSNKRSNRIKSFRYHQKIGDHRTRKLLSSKYWRAAPKLWDCDFSKADGDAKAMFVGYKRKALLKREQHPGGLLYKKRKLLDRSSIITSDGVISRESNSNLLQKSLHIDKDILLEGGTFDSVSGSQPLHRLKDANVKFSIKSLKIPELFIDVPETATVGSLKRTVVEAVTAILGSGLRVGVVLRGKKIRDDSRTLLQSGFSCEENLENLGFTLEPVLEKSQQLVVSEDPPLAVPTEASHQLISVQDANVLNIGASDAVAEQHPLTDPCDHVVDNPREDIPSITDNSVDNNSPDCTAIVPLAVVQMEPLATVPPDQKNKRSELCQRRIRRPFSVTEVEALVHAVEEVGIGRWRDVKLCAFENADHRTYIDLKDKWKTLVHTASISPQQRRGEPVPQELLDRVLSAHACWTQHQGKHNAKQAVRKMVEAEVGAEGIKVGGS